MKKIFSRIFVSLLIVTSLFGFTACGKIVEEINISTSVETKKDYLLTNVYNKPAGTDFNTVESENYITDDNYYVTIKSNVADILTSITIGGVLFNDDDTVSLSVGNNNFLIRNAWKLENESLKIASGLLLSSTSKEGKVAIKYGGKDLNLITLDDPDNITFDITVEGSDATISDPEDGVYTYTSSNYAGYFKIKIKDPSNNSLLTSNSVITVEKIKKDTDGNVIGITYAIAKADLIGDEYYLVFYPAFNAGEPYSASNPANFTMEFRFLVIDVGAGNFTFNFVNSAT